MGILLTLTGLDGSGKTTQAECLSKVCKEKGISTNVIHLKVIESDRYLLTIRKKMREYFVNKNKDTNEIFNLGSALLFQEKVNHEVMTSLSNYDLTILDRYCESALCYHYLRNGLYPSVKRIYDSLVKPDISIYLDLTPMECYNRIIARSVHSPYETLEYLEKAYSFYQGMKENFIWLDAHESIETLNQTLYSILERKLLEKDDVQIKKNME